MKPIKLCTVRGAARAADVVDLLVAAGIDAHIEIGALPAALGDLVDVDVWVDGAQHELASAMWDDIRDATLLGRSASPVCQRCHYSLVGLGPSGHCPECGLRFLSVGPDVQIAPRLEPWHCPTCGERLRGNFDACWRCASVEDVETPVAPRPQRSKFLSITMTVVCAGLSLALVCAGSLPGVAPGERATFLIGAAMTWVVAYVVAPRRRND